MGNISFLMLVTPNMQYTLILQIIGLLNTPKKYPKNTMHTDFIFLFEVQNLYTTIGVEKRDSHPLSRT